MRLNGFIFIHRRLSTSPYTFTADHVPSWVLINAQRATVPKGVFLADLWWHTSWASWAVYSLPFQSHQRLLTSLPHLSTIYLPILKHHTRPKKRRLGHDSVTRRPWPVFALYSESQDRSTISRILSYCYTTRRVRLALDGEPSPLNSMATDYLLEATSYCPPKMVCCAPLVHPHFSL